jgi:hypothetical protein
MKLFYSKLAARLIIFIILFAITYQFAPGEEFFNPFSGNYVECFMALGCTGVTNSNIQNNTENTSFISNVLQLILMGPVVLIVTIGLFS